MTAHDCGFCFNPRVPGPRSRLEPVAKQALRRPRPRALRGRFLAPAILASVDAATPPSNRVGIPIHETLLTAAAVERANLLFPPGRGYELGILQEVETGSGRPDLLLVVTSRGKMRAWNRRSLYLATPSEARVLASVAAGVPASRAGVTPTHGLRILKSLQERGWFTQDGNLVVRPPYVRDSLIVEAKVRDWQKGLTQLAKGRRFAHRAALLVPEGTGGKVNRRALDRNGFGLIVQKDSGVDWIRKPRARSLSPASDLWLTELILRSDPMTR